MNKYFKPEDKIELGLYHDVTTYYYLKYRFLPKKVKIHILWFFIILTVKDHWHVLHVYNTPGIDGVNPDNQALWEPVRFNVVETVDQNRFNSLKKSIETYKDLDEKFFITCSNIQYNVDKSLYKSYRKTCHY